MMGDYANDLLESATWTPGPPRRPRKPHILWTLFQLWRVWRRMPEQRLGQLIENAMMLDDNCYYQFNIRDEELVRALQKFGRRQG